VGILFSLLFEHVLFRPKKEKAQIRD